MLPSKSSACVLLSGGLDSAALFYYYLKHASSVQPVYVRCGLRWEEAELYWLRRFLKAASSKNTHSLRVVFLPMRQLYGKHWSLTGKAVPGPRSRDSAVYLPGRNLFLLSAAAVICAEKKLRRIGLGILKANPFGDATPRFFKSLSRTLTYALNTTILIEAPFREKGKAELIRQASGMPLGLTFSCLNPQTGFAHCGRCNKCAERRRAFRLAGIADPTRYA